MRFSKLGALVILAGVVPYPTTSPASEANSTGFLLERLSPRQIRVWREVERIAFAQDCAGRPLHPRLRRLWCEIDGSGHAVYIEMRPERQQDREAGRFEIVERDPAGRHHVGVIKLCLPLIERAAAGPTRRSDGFIPFDALPKNERIAEVLAHELTHARAAFDDLEYLPIYDELTREIAEYWRYRRENPRRNGAEVERRLGRIARLTRRVEELPEAVEAEVWRELHAALRAPCRRDGPVELRCGR